MSTFMGAIPQTWLRRPLCRRYAVVAFSAASRLQVTGAVAPSRTVWWALGTLINGDCEILGAWNSNAEGAIPAEVFGGLYDRGVEYITYAAGDLAASQAAFSAAYPRAVLLPSIEQSLAAVLASVRSAHRTVMSGLLREAVGDPDCEPAAYSAPGISSEDLRQKYRSILAQWVEDVAGFQGLFALPQPYRRLIGSVDRAAAELQARLTRAMIRNGPFIDQAEAFDFVANWLERADLRLERERRRVLLATEAQGSQPRRGLPTTAGARGAPALV